MRIGHDKAGKVRRTRKSERLCCEVRCIEEGIYTKT